MKVDYMAWAIPVFFILIIVELAYNFYKKLDYYRFNDSISNISQGIGQQLMGIFMKAVLFFGYSYIFEHWKVFEMPKTVWIWIGLFLAVDFFYYWFHRASHQINALWAAHIVHHQSEEYNLTVALRQSWFQGWFSWVFYLPLAFFGFDPIMFVTLSTFNTLYQFWIHTRAIKDMGPLEYILNTPSHHRVHHGSNPKYIDKNHAGTLIIWDRMFGTFQKEQEDVYYGITKPLASWNPVWANFHYWDELIMTAKKSPKLMDKIKVFLKSPGWFPEHLGGIQNAPEIDPLKYSKYNPAYEKKLIAYVLLQFLVALSAGSMLLFSYTKMESLPLIVSAIFTLLTLTTCGALLEQKKWQIKFEYYRLIFGFVIVVFLHFPIGYQVIFSAILLFSGLWFFNLQKADVNEE